MSKRISRRAWLTSVPALGGLLLTGCSRETFVPPRVRGGLIGAADVLDDEHQSPAALRPTAGARVSAKRRSPTRSRPGTRPTRATRSINATCRKGSGTGGCRSPASSSVRASCRSTRSRACLPARKSPLMSANRAGRRSASGRARRSSGCSKRRAASACCALRRHRHLRWVVRGIRSVRGRASPDDPGLRTQRPRPSERQWRAAPSPRRTTVRIQEPQVPAIDSGGRLDGRHWQGHGWNQLGLRVPLVRWGIVVIKWLPVSSRERWIAP